MFYRTCMHDIPVWSCSHAILQLSVNTSLSNVSCEGNLYECSLPYLLVNDFPHIPYLPLASVNTPEFLCSKVTSQVSKRLSVNSWKLPWISCIYSVPRHLVVVCHCFNHRRLVATIYLLFLWNYSDLSCVLWAVYLKWYKQGSRIML